MIREQRNSCLQTGNSIDIYESHLCYYYTASGPYSQPQGQLRKPKAAAEHFYLVSGLGFEWTSRMSEDKR